MFCPKCGNILPDNAKTCDACGASIGETQSNSYTTYQQQTSYTKPVPKIGFGQAVSLYFKRYADFNGRSRRSEYWWATLFVGIVSILLGQIHGSLPYLWSLATLVPGLALSVRRLHDVDKSWAWILWGFLPIVGPIILLIQYCKDSSPANQWGPNPKQG